MLEDYYLYCWDKNQHNFQYHDVYWVPKDMQVIFILHAVKLLTFSWITEKVMVCCGFLKLWSSYSLKFFNSKYSRNGKP